MFHLHKLPVKGHIDEGRDKRRATFWIRTQDWLILIPVHTAKEHFNKSM